MNPQNNIQRYGTQEHKNIIFEGIKRVNQLVIQVKNSFVLYFHLIIFVSLIYSNGLNIVFSLDIN